MSSFIPRWSGVFLLGGLVVGLLFMPAPGGALAGSKLQKPPAEISYSGPEDPKNTDRSEFRFSEWRAGQILSLAVHEANLRDKPGIEGALVGTLAMGSQVVIRKRASEPVFVIKKLDRWYQIEVLKEGKPTGQKGYLFGMVLTPAALKADLDGDGEMEIITLSFSSDFKIRLRIREPGVAKPTHRTIDLQAVGGAYLSQRGSMARLVLEDSKKVGMGLVRVEAFVEACADFASYWVSYQVPGNKAGVLGEAKLAMTQTGVSDPPVHSDFEVTFNPRDKTAVVVKTNSMDDEEGNETSEKSTRSYRLVDGVYREHKKGSSSKEQP